MSIPTWLGLTWGISNILSSSMLLYLSLYIRRQKRNLEDLLAESVASRILDEIGEIKK